MEGSASARVAAMQTGRSSFRNGGVVFMKQRCLRILALLLVFALALPGGSVAAGSGTVHIESDPAGADV